MLLFWHGCFATLLLNVLAESLASVSSLLNYFVCCVLVCNGLKSNRSDQRSTCVITCLKQRNLDGFIPQSYFSIWDITHISSSKGILKVISTVFVCIMVLIIKSSIPFGSSLWEPRQPIACFHRTLSSAPPQSSPIHLTSAVPVFLRDELDELNDEEKEANVGKLHGFTPSVPGMRAKAGAQPCRCRRTSTRAWRTSWRRRRRGSPLPRCEGWPPHRPPSPSGSSPRPPSRLPPGTRCSPCSTHTWMNWPARTRWTWPSRHGEAALGEVDSSENKYCSRMSLLCAAGNYVIAIVITGSACRWFIQKCLQ